MEAQKPQYITCVSCSTQCAFVKSLPSPIMKALHNRYYEQEQSEHKACLNNYNIKDRPQNSSVKLKFNIFRV